MRYRFHQIAFGCCLRVVLCRSFQAGYSYNVARCVFQLVAGLVLILATLTPLANCFDSWDKRQPPVNDTEFQLTALYVFAGFAMVLPKFLRKFSNRAIALARMLQFSRPVALSCSDWVKPEPSASPPLIPLRI